MYTDEIRGPFGAETSVVWVFWQKKNTLKFVLHKGCVKWEAHLVHKQVLFEFIHQKNTFKFVLHKGCVKSEDHLVHKQVLF